MESDLGLTVQEARRAKAKLQSDILVLLQRFEETTEIEIVGVKIEHSFVFGDPRTKVVAVDLDVSLP